MTVGMSGPNARCVPRFVSAWFATLAFAVGVCHADLPAIDEMIIDDTPPSDPHIKASGDFNGDGLPDLLVASSQPGDLIAWYAAPDWTRHDMPFTIGGWSTDAEIVDLDGDGDLDVVISQWYVESWVGWIENIDGGTDWAIHIIGSPRAHDIEVADLDLDGDLDVVARQQGSAGDQLLIWRHDDLTTWTPTTVPCPAGEGLLVGHVDDDPRPDIVIGGQWYRTPSGDLTTEEWVENTYAPNWTHGAARVASGDLDDDGDADLILAPAEGTYRLAWFERPDVEITGEWTEHVIQGAVDGMHSLAIGDMNCDGLAEVVSATMHQSFEPGVRIHLNRGSDTWTHETIAAVGSHNLQLVDLENDGDLDLFGANWSGPNQGVRVWTNNADLIDVLDLLDLLGDWGECPRPCRNDLDNDGTVGTLDLLTLLGRWGLCWTVERSGDRQPLNPIRERGLIGTSRGGAVAFSAFPHRSDSPSCCQPR